MRSPEFPVKTTYLIQQCAVAAVKYTAVCAECYEQGYSLTGTIIMALLRTNYYYSFHINDQSDQSDQSELSEEDATLDSRQRNTKKKGKMYSIILISVFILGKVGSTSSH